MRCAQRDRCRECGNSVERYSRGDDRSIRLHPGELPAAGVPVDLRWHVSSGIAHPAGDGTAWCRLAHAVICPAREAVALPSASGLVGLRRELALRTRRLIDAGAFAPSVTTDSAAPSQDACRPARPIVQLLYVHYLAAHPVDKIQCVAQTRHRDRCTQTLLTSDSPAGIWKLVPTTAVRGQLAFPAQVMALYDLAALPYKEQLRWRMQRCSVHAAVPSAADLAMAEWEPFDPLVHHAHIQSRLPVGSRRPRPGGPARHGARP
ncbi:hypothetical protein CP973_14390 [Streptomyces albofaciens JCM 4342]|uniref:DUF6083 domain-containing protein n=1 Tax=Streptomyces albofaciens TaxID=66866 RepID=UPI001239D4BA|nr:hypothetical protein CP973_14390 [Streptomyces albofaciens JCM 4342]